MLGFSAGGYVTAAVALKHDASSRSNFAAPIYPGIPENVTPASDAPPLFLVHADDDQTVSPMENSIRLYEAWKKAGLFVEMHIYAQGGHGFGMRKRGLPPIHGQNDFATG
jgi:predicted esterase